MKHEQFRWALVTGASSGIGESLALLLASKGINLILNGRDAQRLSATADQAAALVEVDVVPADLAEREGRQAVVEAIRRRAPELVINNAGFGLYGDALDLPISRQMEMVEVNCAAVLELTLEAARALKAQRKKGTIINIASAAAFPVFPCFAVYAASKAFAVRLSESLDEELRPQGVRVLVSCPGMVDTNFRARAGGAPAEQATMSPAFAASEIWRQIETGRTVYIFNWIYRLMIFLVSYILPKRWVAGIVKSNINRRLTDQPHTTDRKGKT